MSRPRNSIIVRLLLPLSWPSHLTLLSEVGPACNVRSYLMLLSEVGSACNRSLQHC